jgi:hypothetical protein
LGRERVGRHDGADAVAFVGGEGWVCDGGHGMNVMAKVAAARMNMSAP